MAAAAALLWIMKWGESVDIETKIITLVLSADSGAALIHSQPREAHCGIVPALLSLGGSI